MNLSSSSSSSFPFINEVGMHNLIYITDNKTHKTKNAWQSLACSSRGIAVTASSL